MPSWWGKLSSKEPKKKTNDETILNTIRRKFRSPSDVKLDNVSISRRHHIDSVLQKGPQSRAESRSSSPSKESKHVARCQSFAERPHAQPLPLPNLNPANVSRTDSGISLTSKRKVGKSSKSSMFPLPRPSYNRRKADNVEFESGLVTASISSDSSVESDDLTESQLLSPQASDFDIGVRTAYGSPVSAILKDQSPKSLQNDPMEAQRYIGILTSKQSTHPSPKKRPLRNHVPVLQVPTPGSFFSAPESSMSSPSRSPITTPNKPYPDVTLLGSGHCSSPGSGQNSMGGDISGYLFWQQPSRGSPEYSPIPSPRRTSPGQNSRVQSGAVTPINASWGDDGKQQSHRLPLPPVLIPSPLPFSHGNSAATSPSVPRSPSKGENLPSPTSCWKKGRLLGRGTFGHVYLGFNSEKGEMCAMKEVTLFSDDPKSKESAKQLQQEIALLGRLRHPNIVQYYGSETVDDKLYIYLEYVSGGSIYKLLQEYGQLGEFAIRSYTQQILSGLAYLHGKNTVHRDIKGANILVDPSGRVKLADFGMAKHITGQSCPLSLKGSPYWMAPEVIKNSNGCNLAVDIWSLGCTILEMATTKPPWSQYEGVAAMFKIGNSKELPTIPDHLSDEGKDFVRLCLQRNPKLRHTAAQLLEHPFVKNTGTLERCLPSIETLDTPPSAPNGMRTLGFGFETNISNLDLERLTIHSSRVSPTRPHSSDYYIPRNISCPVSPIGSPLLHARSPQHINGVMSPSPISSPRTTSGSSTPLTGGCGSIPLYNSHQSFYMQEGFGPLPKSPNNVFPNGPNIRRGINTGPRTLTTLVNSESEIFKKQAEKERERVRPCNGRIVLGDHVSEQLLREKHVKRNPCVELVPAQHCLVRPTTSSFIYH